MKKIHSLVKCLIALTLLLCSSCDHKELCHDHDDHTPSSRLYVFPIYEYKWQYTYSGGTDWEAYSSWSTSFGMEYSDLNPQNPEGLRAQVYQVDQPHTTINLPTTGGIIPLPTTEVSILFYNNDTEYIVFDDVQSYATTRATTRTRARSSYIGNSYMSDREENTVNQPDMLYSYFIPSYTSKLTVYPPIYPIFMKPLVFTYLIRYEFKSGLQYVALARGALAGMAESVTLSSQITSESEATLLFDCTMKEFGAQAIVKSFGAPNMANGQYTKAGNRHALNLEVKLTNGKTLSFDYDITEQISQQPRGGVVVVRDIEISDEVGQEGGSSFDVDIEGWGEFEDIELPL